MILRRLGNKKKIAKKIYIEPFFGAGGMFFSKPKAKFNIVNDLDSDVFNLFQVVKDQKEDFIDAFLKMPIHSDLLEFWKKNEEEDSVYKAIRFLMISNFTFMGAGTTLSIGDGNTKTNLLKLLDQTNKFMLNVWFTNHDFEKFIKIATADRIGEIKDIFIYCDPPYLGTEDNYSNSFTAEQSVLLLDTLEESGAKFAMSEFDHPLILEQAKKRNLHVIIIGERTNLKNRRTEILVTNFRKNKELFDL